MFQVTACHLLSAKPQPETKMTYYQLDPSLVTNFSEIWIQMQTLLFKKMHLKMLSAK